MLGLRPQWSSFYLERPRLLKRLPDEAGYVVWLEAPYGYGKSVLATQWAKKLETEGWRIFWLALQGRPGKPALSKLLGLPDEAPWGVVIDSLWQEKTLLVLEDLLGQEELSPLLKNVEGLLLLASRGKLSYSELLKLHVAGRLLHLDARQLAFSLEESLELIPDSKRAKVLWQRTQGWSLPLHFSALTGEEPEKEALLKGIEESLSPEAWQEALFLAALAYLPNNAAKGASKELARTGFVQVLEQGYRLHALAAEALQQSYPAAIQKVLKENKDRVSPSLQGEAFYRMGLIEDLSEMLDTPLVFADISENPQAFVDWLNLLKQPLRFQQRYNLAIAQSLLGLMLESSLSLIRLAEECKDSRPMDAIYMLGLAAYDLAKLDINTALKASEQGMQLLAATSEQKLIDKAFINGSDLFLNNAAWAYLQAADYEKAEYCYLKALELMGINRPDRVITLANLAYLRWLSHGDLEGYIQATEAMLPYTEKVAIYNLSYAHLELGRFKKLLGQQEAYLKHFLLAQKFANNPLEKLEAQAEIALIKLDTTAYSTLYSQVKAWENPIVEEKILSLWAYCLLACGQAEQALRVIEQARGFGARLCHALVLGRLGKTEEALEQLPEEPPLGQREHYLLWQAAHYRLSLNESRLAKLLDASLSRERVLAGLIPLETLPQKRPELALVYPLASVLESSWQEAIRLRLPELPPLECKVLGQFEARVLGKPLDLTDRHKEIVTLLLLGYNREEIGEALWPDTDTKKVRNNLYVQLNFLRKLLEPWGQSSYLFEEGLKNTQADLWQLNEALGQEDADAIVSLYHPPLAPGIHLDLIQEARESYQQRVIDCLFEKASEVFEEKASSYLERILELDPLYEEALQALLALLLKRGRRREAQRRYHSFANLLKQEMGLEPLAETKALLSQ